MNIALTPGEMLFYGGIAGMAITLIAALIVVIVMSGSRRRLRKKLKEEYGEKVK